MTKNLNSNSTDLQHVDEHLADLMHSVRRNRILSLIIFVVSVSAMICIMASMIAFREQFNGFFEHHFGAQAGEIVGAISYPLLASPPVLAGAVWLIRRIKRPKFCCMNCSASFAIAFRAEAVVRTNKCPACGSIVFPGSNIQSMAENAG